MAAGGLGGIGQDPPVVEVQRVEVAGLFEKGLDLAQVIGEGAGHLRLRDGFGILSPAQEHAALRGQDLLQVSVDEQHPGSAGPPAGGAAGS